MFFIASKAAEGAEVAVGSGAGVPSRTVAAGVHFGGISTVEDTSAGSGVAPSSAGGAVKVEVGSGRTAIVDVVLVVCSVISSEVRAASNLLEVGAVSAIVSLD